jgi:hypothetical protein
VILRFEDTSGLGSNIKIKLEERAGSEKSVR